MLKIIGIIIASFFCFTLNYIIMSFVTLEYKEYVKNKKIQSILYIAIYAITIIAIVFDYVKLIQYIIG